MRKWENSAPNSHIAMIVRCGYECHYFMMLPVSELHSSSIECIRKLLRVIGVTIPPYVKEHYLAAMSIFNAYYHLIPDSHRRKKKVSKFFAERSIKLAKTAIVNGDYFSAKTFVKEAIRMYSWIIKNPFFWIVIGGISVGPSGLKYFKSAKKAFGNKIAH